MQAHPRAHEGEKEEPEMTRHSTSTPQRNGREPITFERAFMVCPSLEQAERIARSFGLDMVAYDDLREVTRETLIRQAEGLRDNLGEKALEMHLQRIVAAYVASAFRAGSFHGEKVSAARSATSALESEARDEDRDGLSGFVGRAERAREFAARTGLQAFACLAAAEGAIRAYAHAIGEDWKPYVAETNGGAKSERKAIAAQMAAFD